MKKYEKSNERVGGCESINTFHPLTPQANIYCQYWAETLQTALTFRVFLEGNVESAPRVTLQVRAQSARDILNASTNTDCLVSAWLELY